MPCFYCRPQCTAPFSDSQGGYSYKTYCYSDIAIDKFEIWGRYIGVSVYLNFCAKNVIFIMLIFGLIFITHDDTYLCDFETLWPAP